jgi:hypothetical protein
MVVVPDLAEAPAPAPGALKSGASRSSLGEPPQGAPCAVPGSSDQENYHPKKNARRHGPSPGQVAATAPAHRRHSLTMTCEWIMRQVPRHRDVPWKLERSERSERPNPYYHISKSEVPKFGTTVV